MKYTNIYTHLIFLLAFEQITCSKGISQKKLEDSPADVSADEAPPPPPPHQDVPQLITPQERESLFSLIKADNYSGIVTFFNKNNLIDYPLIRFQSKDEFNGYTPLAAAIRHCSKDAAKVLAPIQYSFPWTVTVAPGHSLPEIAAKYCPSLLIEVIENINKDHPLAPILAQGIDLNLITQIAFIATDKHTKISKEEYERISEWIGSLFDTEFDHQLNEIIMEELKPEFKNKTKGQAIKMYSDFKILLKNWIQSGRDVKTLFSILKTTKSRALSALVAIESIKIGNIKEFLEALKYFDSDKGLKAETMRKAIFYIAPDHLKSFDDPLIQELRTIFTSLDVDTDFDYFKKSTDLLVSQCPSIYSDLFGLAPAIPPTLAMAATKICNKLVNSAYGDFIQRYPRIDTVIKLFPLDHAGVKVIWIGNDKSIDDDPNFVGFSHKLIKAFIDDDSDALEDLLTGDNWDKKSPNELRFNFPSFNLSLLKTAIMFKKTNIFDYLMSLPDASLHSSTKNQLTAIEMAACYQPDYLIDHILPHIGKGCNKRLRAANNLIAMFKETFFQKCPTGAKNASKILSKLLNSSKESEIACIDFDKKDAIEEAFKYNYPDDLIKAFHSTGKYTKNEFYIFLAAKNGNSDLFNYFVSKKVPDQPSKATEEALATWIRFTDGKLNNDNVEMLEFLLNHKEVKLNILIEDSGISVLSLAVQRSLTWIVKRLLLEKDIDINITDLNTLTTPIQHAINIFRNTMPSDQDISKIRLVRMFHKLAKSLDFNFNYDQVEAELKKLYFWLANHQADSLIPPTSEFYPIFMHAKSHLGLDKWEDQLKGKNCHSAIPVFLQMTNHLANNLEKIEEMLKDPIFKNLVGVKFNNDAISFNYIKFAIIYLRDLLQKVFEKLGELHSLDKNYHSGQFSAASGLVHNVLLSHPDIDTTIENAASIDTLYITKKRTLYLAGDDDGSDEMARTHVRVRNIDSVHDGKKNYKRIAFGVISTLIVGTISAGIIRLMI